MQKILIIGGMPDKRREGIVQVTLIPEIKCPFLRAIFSRLFRISRTKKFMNPDIFKVHPDVIIVYDSGITQNALEQIKNAHSTSRLIFFYFNPASLSFSPSKIPCEYEIWSYSDYDCKKFSLRKNSQVLNPHLWKQCEKVFNLGNDPSFDFAFVGAEKGREDTLNKFCNCVREQSLTCSIFLIKNHFYSPITKTRKRKINYTQYLIEQNKGNVIIDCCTSNNAGLTLRPLEALILRRKIVTNCDELLKSGLMKYGNIISMNATPEELSEFCKKPFSDVPKEALDYYSFENWLARFGL